MYSLCKFYIEKSKMLYLCGGGEIAGWRLGEERHCERTRSVYSLCGTYWIAENDIGVSGAKAIGEALVQNCALSVLKLRIVCAI